MDIVDYILSCDIHDTVAQDFFYYVCKNGNAKYARLCITKFHADFNKIQENGITPLIAACLNNKKDILDLFVELSNITPPSSTIDTNIFEAAKNNDSESVKYLYENIQFYKDIKDENENTPLHICSFYNSWETAESLINDLGVDYEAKNKEGKTPLFISCERNNFDVIKILAEEAVASADECDNDGWSSFHIACLNCSYDIVKYLIEECSASYDEPTQNKAKLFPIHIAALNKEGLDIVKYFIEELDINEDITDANGKTVLHYACQTNNIELVKYLISQYNFDPNIKDKSGKTPLHYACNREFFDGMIEYLVKEAHCDVESMDNNKETPLIVACKIENTETIKYLITECKENLMLVILNTLLKINLTDLL